MVPRVLPGHVSGDLLFQQELARQHQCEMQQGLGKPIISQFFQGQRLVAVGSRIYSSPRWKTFYDFLWYFILQTFGQEWFKAEELKSESERHPVFQWHCLLVNYLKPLQKGGGQVFTANSTGAVEAYCRLAYHLYLVSHNEELPPSLVVRLKNKDQFRGAHHELYVAATFIKAGFTIEFEDESDELRTHCEFTVTHRESGKKFSVEAKARDRETTLIRGQLKKALAKQADHTRIVWFAINAAAEDQGAARAVLTKTLIELRAREGKVMIGNTLAPPAYVVVSNNPYSFALDTTRFAPSAFAEGFQIPDLKFDQKFSSVREMRLCRDKHREIHDLVHSMQAHHRIPTTFDGEDEAFAFGEVSNRLLIGSFYQVPDGDRMVRARLEGATVNLPQKTVLGFFRTADEQNVMSVYPLSDAEIGAYLRHPATFFGVLDLNGKARDALEFFDWMHRTYSRTPKEKLVEFVRGHPDENELQKLSQFDLAIRICEYWTDAAYLRGQTKEKEGDR